MPVTTGWTNKRIHISSMRQTHWQWKRKAFSGRQVNMAPPLKELSSEWETPGYWERCFLMQKNLQEEMNVKSFLRMFGNFFPSFLLSLNFISVVGTSQWLISTQKRECSGAFMILSLEETRYFYEEQRQHSVYNCLRNLWPLTKTESNSYKPQLVKTKTLREHVFTRVFRSVPLS